MKHAPNILCIFRVSLHRNVGQSTLQNIRDGVEIINLFKLSSIEGDISVHKCIDENNHKLHNSLYFWPTQYTNVYLKGVIGQHFC